MGQGFLQEHMLKERAGVTNGDSHDHAGGDGAQIDHGGLAGLADDDHTAYHTAARHKADHSVMRAERITSTQSINDSTTTTIIFNSAVAEDDSAGNFSLNTGTGVITIATAGWYQVDAGFIAASTTAGDRLLFSLVRNGTTLIASVEQSAASASPRGVIGTTYKFSASDTIEATFFHNHGSAVTLTNSERTFMCIRRVA